MLWFDLDNSPHVPLFRPVFGELDKRKVPYFVTARDFAQTKELLALWKIPHTLIGKHGGRTAAGKIINLLQRSNALAGEVKNKGAKLAVSHGSRTQLVAAKRRGIRSLLMLDYEYTEARIFNALATYLLMPQIIPDKRLQAAGFNLKKIIRYGGFKEEIYLKDFVPDRKFRQQVGIDEETILVTLRPPSTTGNYHDARSEELFVACLEHFSSHANAHCLIVQRTTAERHLIPEHLVHRANVSLLNKPVDGLQLIWSSDIVVSGGGTMNRESALLGTKTFSIFTGRRPYLDEHLQEQGKLKYIESVGAVGSIPVVKRLITDSYEPQNSQLAAHITEMICNLSDQRDT